MDFRRVAIFVVMDGLLLAELTFCIWLAHFDPSTVAWTFLKWFLPLAAATALGARWALKRLPPKDGQAASHKYRPVGLFGQLGGDGRAPEEKPTEKP